ncbi:hypothetical protein LIER_08624 [Lithospermum erythrorhizon]|uniref:Putative plant transposon protein domain-containing protein n=1 Tax=Lithospermum erythrorhizon TaxID=34254 RepID=A0AAV3PEU2_LITER
MLNTLKKRSEEKEAEKVGMNKRGEPVPLQSIPPCIPAPEAAPLQPPPILLLPWKDKVSRDEHEGGAPVKFVSEEVSPPMKEDDDIIIVSSTSSRRRTRSSAAALEKKKAALGLGGDPDESMEHSTTVDLEELERKAEERKRKSGEEGNGQSLKLRAKGTLRINDNRNRINNCRIAKDADEVSTYGVDFCGEEHEARWKFVCVRKSCQKDFYRKSPTTTRPTLIYFKKVVKLRGHVFKFNPTLINKHYGFRDEGATSATLKLADIIEELTGKALTAWPTKGQLQASHLSLKYVVLHKASIANLVPTSNNTNVTEALGIMLYVMGTEHVLNVGKIIFDQIVDHAKTGAKLKPIGFPSLICSLLITQHPTVLKKEDGLREDTKSLIISDKLMKGKHVLNVEFNEADQPEPIPEGEAASILLKVYEEELLRVEYEIQAKTILASKLKSKIHALKSRVPPAVNASVDHLVPVATTSTNPSISLDLTLEGGGVNKVLSYVINFFEF